MSDIAPVDTRLRLPVAVFAYNEERLIERCLRSLIECADGCELAVHVLINGCTDGTEAVVRDFARSHPQVVPVVIPLGDKANAWNHYVHVLAPDAYVHFFMDGDMTATPGSLMAMVRCLQANPDANAVAALPASGRSKDEFRDKLIRNRELAGNFYGLTGRMIGMFRERGVRLPVGMFGEDGLVCTLVRWDLVPSCDTNPDRVVPCLDAGFAYPCLDPFNPGDWRIYRNRKMRYAVRRQQGRMLYPLLKSRGIEAMPRHILDLYRECQSALRLSWNGLDTVFDYMAIRRIRKKIKQNSVATFADDARHYS